MEEKVLVIEGGRRGRWVLMCEEVYEEVREIERMSIIVRVTAADFVRAIVVCLEEKR